MVIFFFLSSFFFTFFLIIAFNKFSQKLNLVDRPDHRKIHTEITPVIGGLAISINLLLGVLFFPNYFPNIFHEIIFICSLLAIIGAIDDSFDIHYLIKLIIQSLIILILITNYNVLIQSLGIINDKQVLNLGSYGAAFTLIAILGFINSINFIDGIDGLSSSYVILSLVIFMFLSLLYSGSNFEFFIIYLIISIFTFLIFNLALFGLPKVFLGDSGSFYLAGLIASIFIIYSQHPNFSIHPLLIPWCITLSIYDLLFNTLRRSLRLSNPFKADNFHLHHRLLSIGFNQNKTLFIIILLQILISSFGCIIFYFIGYLVSLITFIILFFIYCYGLVFIKRFSKSES
jgi:UDP-GlcNAc:undecaprenyl-phosphate/decaprenyl-phosphate GlcNAc-1-phosphate transferase